MEGDGAKARAPLKGDVSDGTGAKMNFELSLRHKGVMIHLVVLLALAVTGCTRSPEQRKTKHLTAGKEFYNHKDYSRALLQFQSAVRVAPLEAESYYQLSLAYLGLGDLKKAVLSLNKALDLDPKHIAALLKMAELLASTHDKELLIEAETRVHEVMAISPVNEDALNILGVTEWGLGKREDAEQHLRQALDQFPQDLKAALGLVEIKLLNKDFRGAEELLKKFSAKNPKSSAPVLGLGELYMLVRKPAEAEQQFRRAFEIDPQNELALLDLAGCQFRAGRLEEAERSTGSSPRSRIDDTGLYTPFFCFSPENWT